MVRSARLKDASEIAKIEKTVFSSPWSEVTLIDSMENPCFKFFVAEENEEILGYSGMYSVGDEGFVVNIATDHAHRNKGIGKMVTTALINRGKELGLYSLSLEVRVGNSIATELYAKLGFKDIGIRKGFYAKPLEDARIMTHYYKGE